MRKLITLIMMLSISMMPVFADVTLRGPTATISKEINRYASDLLDLCQYAETKFEKKHCLMESNKILSSDYAEFLKSKTVQGLKDIQTKYKTEFK